MKYYIFIAVILLTVAFQKCHKLPSSTIPTCVQEKIETIKKEPRWNPAAEVKEYKYEGRRVFLLVAGLTAALKIIGNTYLMNGS